MLGRLPGLRVLRDSLLRHPEIELAAVFTHARLPRSEGGGLRPEWSDFQALANLHGFPLIALDGAEARDLARALPQEPLDLMVSLSWRYLVPSPVLGRLRRASINLHRGVLPAFAGAEPVRRAIEAGETRVAITAHHMAEEIDAGRVIATVWLDIAPRPPDLSASNYAEQVKLRLTPLYAPLLDLAITAVLEDAP